MKNILFITAFPPNNKSAGDKYTKIFIEQLSAYFKIDLIYFSYKNSETYQIPNSNVRIIDRLLLSSAIKLGNAVLHPTYYPLFSVRYRTKIRKMIEGYIAKNGYSCVVLNYSQVFLYGLYLPGSPKILITHDVIYQRVKRSSNRILSAFCHSSESRVISSPNATVFTFSPKDISLLKDIYNVDAMLTNSYLEDEVLEAIPSQLSDYFVLFGNWRRADNTQGLMWFFKNVYPHVQQKRIKIVGANMPQKAFKLLSSYSNVEYLGFVDNPYPLIANSIAVIAPLFSGAGIKVKVVESLACGAPVLGTAVAFEGVSTICNNFMLHAETAAEYIHSMNEIHFSISERVHSKRTFLKNHISGSIVDFIRESYE